MPDPRQFSGGLLGQGGPEMPIAPQQGMPPGAGQGGVDPAAIIEQLMQLPPQEMFNIYMQAPPEIRQIIEQVPQLMEIIQAFSQQNQQQTGGPGGGGYQPNPQEQLPTGPQGVPGGFYQQPR